MGKIIVFGDFINKKQKVEFTKKLQEKVNQIESELGLDDEPLTVLTDDAALNLVNCLIDARDSINDCLGILNVEESEDLSYGITD